MDSTGTVQAIRPIPYQRLRIEEAGFGTGQSEWIVTTADGIRYTFGAREGYTPYNLTTPGDQMPVQYGPSYSHTSSWYLTEVRHPGGDVITFHYSPYVARHRLDHSYVEQFHQVVSNDPSNPCVPAQFTVMQEYETQALRLDSIASARHTVRFIEGDSLRADALDPGGVRQEPRLARIEVWTPDGTTQIRRFQLEHDYFGGNRLRLKRVQEHASGEPPLPPWTFTYDPQSFPPRDSMAQDHWGFWNGKDNNTSLLPPAVTPSGAVIPGADRNPDGERMTVGSLRKITYPTGGSTEFFWEPNEYGRVGSDTSHVVVPGDAQNESVSSSDFQGFQSTPFTVGGVDSAVVQVSTTVLPSECGDQIGCPFAEILGEGLWTGSTQTSLVLEPGTYTLRTYSDFTGGFASISVSWQDMEEKKKVPAGGLRVAQIVADDGFGNQETRVYRYTLADDPERSSGVIGRQPEYHYFYSSPQCQYFSRASRSRVPLGDGAPVQYSEATVLYGPNGEFGSAREVFRTHQEAADPWAAALFRVTSRAWKRGQRLERAERSASGDLQRRERTTYLFHDNHPETAQRFRGLSAYYFSAGQRGTAYTYNDFEVISAWYHPASDSTAIYDESGSISMSTVRSYLYENPEHLQVTEIRETNSDGTERVTRMRYPADYSVGGGNPGDEAEALLEMQGEAHIHSAVIERWVSEVKGGIERVLEGEVRTFRLFLGRPLPYRRFVLDWPEGQP